MKKADLLNKQFGRWLVTSEAPNNIMPCGRKLIMWNVICTCGNTGKVASTNLIHKKSTSCGCYKNEVTKNRVGKNNPNWTGGIIYKDGYKLVLIPDHPNSESTGYVREHFVVMTKKLGRALYGHEQVHHKNGVKDDNRIENLELWSTSHPSGQRVEDKITWAKELLEQYKNYESFSESGRR
jgi:hypothetical protein